MDGWMDGESGAGRLIERDFQLTDAALSFIC